MIDSKVYIALSHLSVYELNSFRKYLNSPYFNQNEHLLFLFDIYDDSIRNDKTEHISKEEIWSTVYEGKKYNDVKFRKLNSELLKTMIEFLAQRVYDSDLFLKQNLMLKGVRKKKITKLYNSVVNATNRGIENTYNRSSDYLHAKFFNEKEQLSLYSENEIMRMRSKKIETLVNIDVISEHLDQYYISEKLKYYVKLLGWKKVINFEQEMNHIDSIENMLKSGDYDDIAPIAIYHTISKTLLEPNNIDNYYKLKEQVNQYVDSFPENEIRNIYDALLSFCVRRVNKGDLKFQEETLKIYKDALAKEVLFENGMITSITFNNIVFFALRTGEYDWAENFVKEYSPLLNEKDRLSSVAISLARINFYRKDYEAVIPLLQQVEMESVVFNLSAKTILMLSYYELDEFDALDSFISSFRVYVNREKSISSRKKTLYKNLLRFVKKLINLQSYDKESIEKLRKEINESQGVIVKPWLLEKLDEK